MTVKQYTPYKAYSDSRRSQFKPIASLLARPVKKIISKRGFDDSFLIVNWNDIVGKELGQITRPHSFKGVYNKSATLKLDCVGAYVAELTMRKEEIKMKVNAALGCEAIDKIIFVHQGFGFAEAKQEFEGAPAKTCQPPMDLQKDIERSTDSALKQALAEISSAYYSKKDRK